MLKDKNVNLWDSLVSGNLKLEESETLSTK